MTLPKIPHAADVWVIKEPLRDILHVRATTPQYPAHEYANERYELRKAVAEAVGFRTEIADSQIHWTDDDA